MRNKYSGASLTEFIVAAPIVMLIGMVTVQAALIYHGKTTLNYATFEAARTGAVNHAQVTLMLKELGQRLAPVQGGDGSLEMAALAVAQTIVEAERSDITRLEILNPTIEAFEDWGVHSQTTHHRVIPNNHLRHKGHQIGQASGLSVRDANLLKIKVTYGLDLKVPVVGRLIALAMTEIDAENAHFYSRKKFPLMAVATVRMQSEVWEQEILAARTSSHPPAEADSGGGDGIDDGDGQQPPTENTPDPNGTPANLPDPECEGGEYGLGSMSELINTSDYNNQQCPTGNPAFNTPSSGGLGAGGTVCN
jgi:hypothetical protein